MMLQGFVAGPGGSRQREHAGADLRAGCAAKESRQASCRASASGSGPAATKDRLSSDTGEERHLRLRSGRQWSGKTDFALLPQKYFSLLIKTPFPTSGINGVLDAGGGRQGGAEAAAPAEAPGSKHGARTAGGKRPEHHSPSQLTVSELLVSRPSTTAATRCHSRKKSPNRTSLPRVGLDTRSAGKHQPYLSPKVWQRA